MKDGKIYFIGLCGAILMGLLPLVSGCKTSAKTTRETAATVEESASFSESVDSVASVQNMYQEETACGSGKVSDIEVGSLAISRDTCGRAIAIAWERTLKKDASFFLSNRTRQSEKNIASSHSKENADTVATVAKTSETLEKETDSGSRLECFTGLFLMIFVTLLIIGHEYFYEKFRKKN